MAPITDYTKGLEAVVVLTPSRCRPHPELQRAVCRLEVITTMLELLECVDHLAQCLPVQLQAEFSRLDGQGRSARHLAHHEAGPVADGVRGNVLVGVAAAGYGAYMQTTLVGERRRPHIRLLGVGRDVD